VVGHEARRQQDRADPLGAQVEPRRARPHRDGSRTVGRPDLVGQSGLEDVPVDGVEEPVHPPICGLDGAGQVVAEAGDVSGDLVHVADEPDPACPQGAEVEVPVPGHRVVATDQLQRRLVARRHRVGHVVDGAGQPAGGLQPPEHVQSAVAARQSGVPAHREHHLTAGPRELVGDLDAGRRGTDHEHASGGELPRVAVVVRGQHLGRPQSQWHVGLPVRAGGDDHPPGAPGALVRDDPVVVSGRRDFQH
jgi:hypothetical protein